MPFPSVFFFLSTNRGTADTDILAFFFVPVSFSGNVEVEHVWTLSTKSLFSEGIDSGPEIQRGNL